jgi:hypothetical protein
MGRKSESGSGIRDEPPGSYFLELRNNFFGFFGVKILKYFDADPGSRIRDGDSSDPGWKKSDPGSGINIPDPQHCKKHVSELSVHCVFCDPNFGQGTPKT